MKKIISGIGIALVIAIWLGLTAMAWFGSPEEISVSERRRLEQFPTLSMETLLQKDKINPIDGSVSEKLSFMTLFGDYSLDQFPARDSFRKIKSLFHYYVMQQKDNNDIYIEDGYAAMLQYPLNKLQLDANLNLFNKIYEEHLKNRCKVYMAVIPDKSYFLAEQNGYPAMDYAQMFATVKEKMPWAKHIDLTPLLDIEDYYYTDTHWRQECILPVAQTIAQAMNAPQIQESDYTAEKLDYDFYGVYHGFAALPMEPESISLMQSEVLRECRVYDYETKSYSAVYNLQKLEKPEDPESDPTDPYDVYLSGARGLLRIENPNPKTYKHLIVFRDSFGSSLSPLLVQNYATVTLVDLRYYNSDKLNELHFGGKDVLFLFNTQVLNSAPLK